MDVTVEPLGPDIPAHDLGRLVLVLRDRCAGVIPAYTRDADGTLHGTTLHGRRRSRAQGGVFA